MLAVLVVIAAVGCGESLDVGAEHEVTLRQAEGGECNVWVATTPGGAHFESVSPPPPDPLRRPLVGLLRILSPRNAMFEAPGVSVPMIQVEIERFCGFGP